uniref:Ribonuclease A-domain domain-containing protein n=1 Tax=Oreochromis aureus TaxID=47969 RepID=A0A668T3Z3_OREAU
MVQCTRLLLLLLLSTAVFSQTYDDFIKKHTLVMAKNNKDCDTLMKAVNDLENSKKKTPGKCKEMNTFIDESNEQKIQNMCKGDSDNKFVDLPDDLPYFDCVIKDKNEPCSYRQINPKKRIKCEKSKDILPVHLEAVQKKTQQLIPV